MRGSIEMSDSDGFGYRGWRERSPLDRVRVRDCDAVVALTTLLRRRMMKSVATMKITRRAIAPPMIPPISAFVRPPLPGALVGLVFRIAVAEGVTLAMTPPGAVLLATSVGNVGVEAVVTVDVTVWGRFWASVVVRISVMMKVVTEVA